jgi:hypothetical protein
MNRHGLGISQKYAIFSISELAAKGPSFVIRGIGRAASAILVERPKQFEPLQCLYKAGSEPRLISMSATGHERQNSR